MGAVRTASCCSTAMALCSVRSVVLMFRRRSHHPVDRFQSTSRLTTLSTQDASHWAGHLSLQAIRQVGLPQTQPATSCNLRFHFWQYIRTYFFYPPSGQTGTEWMAEILFSSAVYFSLSLSLSLSLYVLSGRNGPVNYQTIWDVKC